MVHSELKRGKYGRYYVQVLDWNGEGVCVEENYPCEEGSDYEFT